MSRNMQVGLVAVAMVSLVGCYQGVDVEDLVDEIADMRDAKQNAIMLNGFRYNGFKYNGFRYNGFRFNGFKYNGFRFNGIRYNGFRYNDVSLDGSSIEVKTKSKGKWIKHAGETLVGMEFDINVDVIDDQNVEQQVDFIIRADDIYTDLVYDDIYYYDLSISVKGTDTWQPLCEGGTPAIPMQHYWDETTGDRIDDKDFVTFACTSGVLAHCAQWGYRPWAEAEQCDEGKKGKKKKCRDISLADHHQACTRMARADYCGDGVAWTVAGTPIDIYDALDPQLEASETDWPVEAEWKPNGAYCLNDIRQQGWKAEGKYPKCKGSKAKVVANCGTLKDDRALVASKFEPLNQ